VKGGFGIGLPAIATVPDATTAAAATNENSFDFMFRILLGLV